jgi:membrane protein insertase Oxa1/YidC/SpoIIIJ
LLSGFVATLALTTMLSASQGFGLTRMNLVYLIGTFITPQREKAKFYGFMIHLLNGLGFSILYVLIFQTLKTANWWLGLLLGFAHALFVLTVGMALMPGLHPRMASEQHGPNANRQLEPPGFMALHYGIQTPLSVFLAHAAYGAIIGSLYHLAK